MLYQTVHQINLPIHSVWHATSLITVQMNVTSTFGSLCQFCMTCQFGFCSYFLKICLHFSLIVLMSIKKGRHSLERLWIQYQVKSHMEWCDVCWQCQITAWVIHWPKLIRLLKQSKSSFHP